MQDGAGTASADHLCVLIHGLWGNPNHLQFLATSLRQKYSEDRLHILCTKRNAGTYTYDGIEVGGERVTQEIEEELEQLARDGKKVKKISFVGYSLGGLVARYVVGLLYHKGWFEEGKLQPINFTTFASPHLGVRTPLVGYHNQFWNVLGARILATSGQQLFIVDKFRDTARPLLSVLADPNGPFIRGLALFKHRSLYANVVNDRSAVYYTTAISKIDPYNQIDKLNINYVPGYEPVILDSKNPVMPKEDEHLPLYQRLTGTGRAILGKVPFVLFLTVFIPVGSVLFFVNAGVQSIRSSKRIKLHEEGKTGITPGSYRIPLMIDDMRRTAENMYENVNQRHDQEYLPSGTGETDRRPSDPGEKSDESLDSDEHHPLQPKSAQLEFPTLALTDEQFAMIAALDDVGWKKHPVYIHAANHSHAAIIKRMSRESFHEGEIVVKHWLSEFEI